MQIPEIIYCGGTFPACGGLALIKGAVLGGAADYDFAALSGAADGTSVFYAECTSPDDAEGLRSFEESVKNVILLADAAGVHELSFLPVRAETKNSRLFAVNAALFRVLMAERESHPSLEGIRFLCRDKEDAEWLARVYNFYYPATKSERMTTE